jgi:hypothetical protein
MADGFLGRWAKRKEAVRKGVEVPAEPVAKAEPSPQPSPASGRGSEAPAAAATSLSPSPPGGEGRGEGIPADQPPPLPTLEDVESLTPASDFSRYMQRGVDPQVKNAAVKKLWADPRYNIQDGLDVYIDDYGKPDPIPPEMLRQMVSAKFLKLFDDEEEKEEKERQEQEARARPATDAVAAEEPDKDPMAREAADAPPAETVAQSCTAECDPAVPPADQHADPDLRLQQDDAPGHQGPGGGSI